jgi:hypothetical protein
VQASGTRANALRAALNALPAVVTRIESNDRRSCAVAALQEIENIQHDSRIPFFGTRSPGANPLSPTVFSITCNLTSCRASALGTQSLPALLLSNQLTIHIIKDDPLASQQRTLAKDVCFQSM